MPWTVPISVMSGRISISKVISSNQQIFNLWDDCGQPTSPADIDLTINSGIFVDTFIVGNWAPTTILNITHLGTIRGAGGIGGRGGDGESTTDVIGYDCNFAAAPGKAGLNGGSAIFNGNSATLQINIDMDLGFLWGAGGGGGGGGSVSGPGNGWGGGGGGGGRGWNVSAGGLRGFGPTADGTDGVDGGPTGAGAGGIGGGTARAGDGGAGGTNYGDAGSNGLAGTGGLRNCSGGSGGASGSAIFGTAGSVVLTGAKSEATLITEGRILGSIAT